MANQRRYISTFSRSMDPKLSRILVILWLLRQRFTEKETGRPARGASEIRDGEDL